MRWTTWSGVLSIVLAGTSVTTPAQSLQPYASATLGYEQIDVERDFSIEGQQEQFNSDNLTGMNITLATGILKSFDNGWFGAVEGNLSHSNADRDVSSDLDGGFTETLERDGLGYGISALAGRDLNTSTTGYLRFGYQLEGFESKVVDVNPSFTESSSDQFGGIVLGGGLAVDVSEQVALRFEYMRTQYHGSEDWSFFDGESQFEPKNADRVSVGALIRL